jgi:hypothetical protein
VVEVHVDAGRVSLYYTVYLEGVHTICPEDILPCMYPGSFSAVIAASKYVEDIIPTNGGLHNFSIGVGAVLLTLGPETNGQRSK